MTTTFKTDFPISGGADEKLEYLSSVLSSSQLVNSDEAPVVEVNLKLQAGPDGRVYAAGFSLRGQEIADLPQAVHDALDDGCVTQIEKQAIRKEIEHVRHELSVMDQSVKVA